MAGQQDGRTTAGHRITTRHSKQGVSEGDYSDGPDATRKHRHHLDITENDPLYFWEQYRGKASLRPRGPSGVKEGRNANASHQNQ